MAQALKKRAASVSEHIANYFNPTEALQASLSAFFSGALSYRLIPIVRSASQDLVETRWSLPIPW